MKFKTEDEAIAYAEANGGVDEFVGNHFLDEQFPGRLTLVA